MKQADAKRRAELLLDRHVKCKQKDGMCMIFPSTTKGLTLVAVTFTKTTDYYGRTWDEAITKIEDHVRFNTKTGQPVEGQLVRCPNCGDHENLDLDETTSKFHCETCNHTWDSAPGMDIVAEMQPPQITREAQPEGAIILTDAVEPDSTKQEGK